MLTENECPICNGSRRMEIVVYIGTKKRKVKVPCTACEGRGKILFVDLSKPQEMVEVEEPISRQVADGWRKSPTWNSHSKVFFLSMNSLHYNNGCRRRLPTKGIDASSNEDPSY